jgi:hypothetical protein
LKIHKKILSGIISKRSLNISNLIDVRKKALRQGLWFQAIDSMQRGIVNLTIRYVSAIRSNMLGLTLQNIFLTLAKALERGFLHKFYCTGRELAENMSNAAHSWGNQDALNWKFDATYIICLGMNKMSGWSYH